MQFAWINHCTLNILEESGSKKIDTKGAWEQSEHGVTLPWPPRGTALWKGLLQPNWTKLLSRCLLTPQTRTGKRTSILWVSSGGEQKDATEYVPSNRTTTKPLNSTASLMSLDPFNWALPTTLLSSHLPLPLLPSTGPQHKIKVHPKISSILSFHI